MRWRCGDCGSRSARTRSSTVSGSRWSRGSASRSSGNPERARHSPLRALLGLTPSDATVTSTRSPSTEGMRRRSPSALAGAPWRRHRPRLADALVSLDPLRRIGAEVAEPLRLHDLARGRAALDSRVRELLRRVWMPDAERRARQYAHELSGGLRQRALIASAIAAAPWSWWPTSRRPRSMPPCRHGSSACCAISRRRTALVFISPRLRGRPAARGPGAGHEGRAGGRVRPGVRGAGEPAAMSTRVS